MLGVVKRFTNECADNANQSLLALIREIMGVHGQESREKSLYDQKEVTLRTISSQKGTGWSEVSAGYVFRRILPAGLSTGY